MRGGMNLALRDIKQPEIRYANFSLPIDHDVSLHRQLGLKRGERGNFAYTFYIAVNKSRRVFVEVAYSM
jgi:hypothetical protein